MRTIEISTSVYASIWSRRVDGEESEDQILKRIIVTSPDVAEPFNGRSRESLGIRDNRNTVVFPSGFEVFRTYRGTEFRARVENDAWALLNTNAKCRSLNGLSKAIGAGTENAWVRWQYEDKDGSVYPVANLRPAGAVSIRKKRNSGPMHLDKLTEIDAALPKVIFLLPQGQWLRDVYRGLLVLGGSANLPDLYGVVRAIRAVEDSSLPLNADAVVRKNLEESSSDSEAFLDHRPDLFAMTRGKGEGFWAIRSLA